MNEIQPTQEQINQDFSALNDSVNLINQLTALSALSGSLNTDDYNTLIRNKEHISIMLAKDFIINDPRDKSIYIAAI
jgi:hypothetical protein